MPRIPVRVEPYSSPSRQHRHYKNKRDQVLRALGKAAYINGSHFAIMWVSARGDVETYASEALQSRLEDWFVKGGIADEAKELVKGASGKSMGMRVFEDDGGDEDVEAEGVDEEGDEDVENAGEEDVFLDTTSDRQQGSKARGGKPLAPLNTAIANQHFLRSRSSFAHSTAGSDDLIAPRSAPLFPSSNFPTSEGEAPRTSTPLLSTSARMLSRNSLSTSTTLFPSSTLHSSTTPLHEITLSNSAARTAFLELRFGQLQQGVCKTVAKAWIKIIEPKKQTRCPYNKGEAGKPDWWPAGVRHKEPDHLMKPERHALLLTILRSPKVKVARLQLATAEVVALIKADKVSLLMDVYRIAREEEKIRERKAASRDKAGKDGEDKEGEESEEEEVKVKVSTLDGWCKEGSKPTSQGRQIARSVTPPPTAASVSASQKGGEEGGAEKGKKRTAASMTKSLSTSAAAANKRRSIATTNPSSSLSNEILPRSALAQQHNNVFGYPQPHNEIVGLGLLAPVARSRSFSAISSAPPRHAHLSQFPHTATSSSAGGSCDTSPWPTNLSFAEVNGLVTPLAANSTAIDPAFATDPLSHPHAQGGQQFYYPNPHQPPQPTSFYETTAIAPEQGGVYEHNALGLNLAGAGWMDGFDMSQMADLSSSSWPTGGGGEASFSMDSLGPPRTPSPGPVGQLNLDLGGTNKPHQHQQGIQHQHEELWLSGQHQHHHHHHQQQQAAALAEWHHHHQQQQQQMSQASS